MGNVVVTIQTSVHSRDGESKEDDDIMQSEPQDQSKDVSKGTKGDDDSESTEETSKETPPPSPSLLRRKGCLSVRTVEESLSMSSLRSSGNRSNISDFSVSFHKLQVREYELILVNNPSCGGGPPIGIGNKFVELEDVDLKEMFDKEKKYIKLDDKPEGPYDKLYIKPYDRLAMLKKNGYTDQQILEGILEATEVQRQRTESATANDKDEEKKEMINKVTKKLIKLVRTQEQKKHDKFVKSFYNKAR